MKLTQFAYAQQLDANDPLKRFKERFVIVDPSLTYLDGNSLGRLTHAARRRAADLVEQWGEQLIRSWGQGWMDASTRIGGKIAQLVGAKPHEVILADSTSVNLFKLVTAALHHQPGRMNVITDDLHFPSDVYILRGEVKAAGRAHQVQMIPSPDSIHGPVNEIAASIDADTALVTLSHTVFKSGYVYDMAALTAEAHKHGALVLWDLSHSAGAVPVDLSGAGVDLAVGCTYKYLNGGPGAPAFLYVREGLQDQLENPISGWMGQKNMFEFDLTYQPEQGLRRFLTGTPPILSLSLVEPGVDLLLEAGMDALREKSMRQTEYLIALWEAWLEPLGYALNSPRTAEQRGSHVSLGHEEGLRIDQCLIEDYNIIPDFRAPDNIRLGITPLYTTYQDIYRAANALREIVDKNQYERFSHAAPRVT